MPIQFNVIKRGTPKQAVTNQAVAYLEKDDWDDYSFRTSFDLTIFDAEGRRFDLGHVKIGYKGQVVPEVKSATYTASYLPPFFETLDDIFSVGQDVEYYKKLLTIAEELRVEILKGLKDVAFDLKILNDVCNEEVFISSLRRDEADPIKEVKTKFREILGGASVRTPFNFKYKINIKIFIEEEQIKMLCENKYDPERKVKDRNNGLGNDLIEKRLKLIYQDRHNLLINKQNNSYQVTLIIQN